MRRAYGGSRCGGCVKQRCVSWAIFELQTTYQCRMQHPPCLPRRGGQDRQEGDQVTTEAHRPQVSGAPPLDAEHDAVCCVCFARREGRLICTLVYLWRSFTMAFDMPALHAFLPQSHACILPSMRSRQNYEHWVCVPATGLCKVFAASKNYCAQVVGSHLVDFTRQGPMSVTASHINLMMYVLLFSQHAAHSFALAWDARNMSTCFMRKKVMKWAKK